MEAENRSVQEPVPILCRAVVEEAASTWDQARRHKSVAHANAVLRHHLSAFFEFCFMVFKGNVTSFNILMIAKLKNQI